ncbi:MAG: peptide ABC transporter substrate-binding protein [bacterium]
MRGGWLLACGCVLAVLAVGCGGREDRAYSRGSTVTVAYCCGKQTLAPAWDMEAKFLVFLPLVAEDENGELEGRLARRWEHSPDYREWTYHLRTDVRWHDGVPVTAQDIKFTVDLLAHVPGATPFLIESITVLDDSTVRVRYTQTTARWDSWWVFYPKHLLEHLDPKKLEDWEFWTHPVGNGPYRFVRYQPDTMMEFEANPDYYRGKPKIERVVLKFAGDAGLTELLSGNVDALPGANRADIPKLAADPRFRVCFQIGPDLARVIYWQNDHPLFRDPNIRRALTLAIDRRGLLRALNLPDNIAVFDGPLTRRQLRRGQLPEPLPYDPARARALLDAAGWRDGNGDGIRERDGKPFRFTTIVSHAESGGVDEWTAVYLQEQLRRVGVRMDIQVLDRGVPARLKSGEFEAAILHFRHSAWWLQQYVGRNSPIGYSNAEVARQIDQAMVTADPEVLDGIYQDLMEIFRADVPVTFLTPQVNTYIAHRRIRGLSSPWRANPVEYMEDLWLEDGKAE